MSLMVVVAVQRLPRPLPPHELCTEHGITAEELRPSTKSKPHATGTVAAKYCAPEIGATWAGRGKEPVWIHG